MRKACMILTSVVGGAILGSAITMFMTPKSGEEMRKDAQNLFNEQLNHIHEHIKKCKCMMGNCESEAKTMDEEPMKM